MRALQYSIFFFLILLLRLCFLIFIDLDLLLTYIPDDSFYYLELSKNFILHGHWSFDGINPSSGFHLLYGYFVVLAMKLFGVDNFYGVFVFLSLINICLLTFSFKIILKLLFELIPNNRFIVITLLLMFLSKSVIFNSTFLIESSFTIFWISLLTYLIFSNTPKQYLLVKISFVSILGQSFRFDFGIITFILFVFFLFRRNKDIKYVFPIIFSSITLILQILHNFLLKLSFPPSSSIIKSFWALDNGLIDQLKSSLNIILIDNFLSFNFDRVNRYSVIILVVLYIIFLLYNKYKTKKFLLPNNKLFIVSLTIVLTYFVFYLRNGAIQIWYIQNIHVSLTLIFIFIILSLVDFFKLKNTKYFNVIFFLFLLLNIYGSFVPMWPNQLMMYKQSQYLDYNNFKKVGSFNSGIIGYFTKKTVVVNLDGLVNDKIPKYSKKNSIGEYCFDNDISFITDFKLAPSLSKGISNNFYKRIKIYDSLIPLAEDNILLDENAMNKHYIYKIDEKTLSN